MVGAPSQVDEFRVDAATQNLGVAVLKFLVQFAERGDPGRPNEGEVLRLEEKDSPLVLVVLVGNGFECIVLISVDGCSKTKIRKLLSYT